MSDRPELPVTACPTVGSGWSLTFDSGVSGSVGSPVVAGRSEHDLLPSPLVMFLPLPVQEAEIGFLTVSNSFRACSLVSGVTRFDRAAYRRCRSAWRWLPTLM